MVNIDQSTIKTVDVVIGGEHYGVPLLTQLSVKDFKEMTAASRLGDDAEFDWSMKYLQKYIPEDVFDTLRMQDIIKIFNAVKDETAKDGTDLGES